MPGGRGPARRAGRRTSPALSVVVGIAVALASYGLSAALRRRRRPRRAGRDEPLGELRRALLRSGRPLDPQMTLGELAARYRGSPAEGYLRALAAERYGYGESPPTPSGRAALRCELGAGLGPQGRLPAWWALPPRLPAWIAERRTVDR